MEKILIGRKKYIEELEAAYKSSKPEMLALIGRRRVGKTYLVRQIYGERLDFELTGLQYGDTKRQLQNFLFAMEEYFPEYKLESPPSDWMTAFNELSKAIKKRNKEQKVVIFLDELPWLSTARSGFISALGFFWNSRASKQNIVVIICGSAASWMIKKIINNRGGLHNRITRLLYMYPFSLAETESYCQAKQIKLNRFQLLQLYMTMGGIPMYLDLLKPGLSAVQNIQEICFSETGYLRNEFDRLFASLFDNFEKHVSIVRTLGSKRKGLTRQEIIDQTKLSNGGGLTSVLEELEKSGFITAYGGYKKKRREVLYRLTDFYSHFYLTFLEKTGKSSMVEFTGLSDLPAWKTWSGYAFENICLAHISQIKKALGIRGIASSTATFFAKPKDGLPGAQIDLLIDRSDQTINICEAKFSQGQYELTKKAADNLQVKQDVFRYHTKSKKHLFSTLITTYGVVDNVHKLNHIDQVVTMEDMFTEG